MPKQFPPIDLSNVRTYPLSGRPSKVSTETFASPLHAGASVGNLLAAMPDILAAGDFRRFVRGLADAIRAERTVAAGIGGHVIKCGLAPLLIDWMRRGWLSVLAMNGAAAIHDALATGAGGIPVAFAVWCGANSERAGLKAHTPGSCQLTIK